LVTSQGICADVAGNCNVVAEKSQKARHITATTVVLPAAFVRIRSVLIRGFDDVGCGNSETER
jgi:hypothetical protein